MATLGDLINELLKHNISLDKPANDDDQSILGMTNEKTFGLLTTYMPIIPVKNLELFVDDVKERFYQIESKIQKKDSHATTQLVKQFYRINKPFYDTLYEQSLKYNSIIRKNDPKTNIEEALPYSKAYSSIYYQFHIQLLKLILKMDFDDIALLLNDYYIEQEDIYDDDNDDSDYENIKNDPEYIENLVINNNTETGDDEEDSYVYEPYQNTSTDLSDYYQTGVCNWNTISRKLEPIIKTLTYDALSHDSVWEDFSILEDIQDISAALFDNSNLKEIYDYFPNFIYLLVDRILHKPTDIPYILPVIINIIKFVSPEDEKMVSPFGIKTLLSVFDNLVSIQSLPSQSIQSICNYIIKYMSFFNKRLQDWVALPDELFNQINSKFEFESILNIMNFYSDHPLKEIDNGDWSETFINQGIFTQFMDLVLRKLLNGNDESTIKAMSMFCCKSERLSHCVQKVPEFIDLVLNNEKFKNSFNHYHTIWYFILSLSPLSNENNYFNNFTKELNSYLEKLDTRDKKLVLGVEIIFSILVISKQSNPKLKIFSTDDTSDPFQTLLVQFEKKLIQLKQQQQSTNENSETARTFQIFQNIRSYIKYLRIGSNK